VASNVRLRLCNYAKTTKQDGWTIILVGKNYVGLFACGMCWFVFAAFHD
jgi:hypothetical protein